MEKLGYNVITAGKVFSNDYPKAFYNMIQDILMRYLINLDACTLLY